MLSCDLQDAVEIAVGTHTPTPTPKHLTHPHPFGMHLEVTHREGKGCCRIHRILGHCILSSRCVGCSNARPSHWYVPTQVLTHPTLVVPRDVLDKKGYSNTGGARPKRWNVHPSPVSSNAVKYVGAPAELAERVYRLSARLTCIRCE